MKLIRRLSHCPLCKTEQASKELYKSSLMRVVRCTNCKLMYQNPRTPELELADAYSALAEYTHYDESRFVEAKKLLFRRRIQLLRDRIGLKPSGRFLYIGASYGAMIKVVKEQLPEWETYGVEPSTKAREGALDAGVALYSSVDELPPDSRFEWINLDNTLEHFDDPLEGMKRLKGCLAPGGFIYIDVPNESRFTFRYRINDLVRGEKKPPTFPGHMTLFTKDTLRRLIEEAGFGCEVWSESVSAPHRFAGVCGQDERQFQTILGLLRTTHLDSLLGMDYFLCAIARA